MDFKELAISDELKKAVEELGFTEATDIQAQSIPLILQGVDVIGFSQTGSGKTAAFGLPAIESVDMSISPRKTQILILCPTRELAMQGAEELRKFAKYVERLHIVTVFGGQSIERQITQIKSGCQIVIGTPGRIIDHIGRKTLKLGEIKTVILDEADEMLNMGFREDIETILSSTPDDRQTILFSATMPKAIIEITDKYQTNPQMVKIERKQMTVETIEQSYYEVPRGRKKDALSLLMQYYKPKLSIVFCNTKKMVDEIASDMKQKGYKAECLHGDIKQSQRTKVMNDFKAGRFNVLVATDVASRGIDVNDIDIVFNFDLPDEAEYYVHRIGRTARAGKTGKSITLIQGPRQYRELNDIARYTKSTIEKGMLPTIAEIQSKNLMHQVKKISKFASENDCSDCADAVDMLKRTGLTDDELLCTLMKMYLKGKVLKKGTVDVSSEDYSRSDRRSRYNDRDDRNSRGRNGRDDRHKKRVPNERAKKKFENVDMSSITISIGRMDKVAPKHILGAVAGESGLPGKMMGTIDIKKNHTTIDVPTEYKKKIIKSLNNKKIKDKVVTVK